MIRPPAVGARRIAADHVAESAVQRLDLGRLLLAVKAPVAVDAAARVDGQVHWPVNGVRDLRPGRW
jgi:hypothetical protein